MALDPADELKFLFSRTRLAALSTQKDGNPYCNLVAFAATDDLSAIIFATERSTRKFTKVVASPRVSILIDDRSNEVSDFKSAIAVTVVGQAGEAAGREREKLLPVYLERHPYLEQFATSPTCALVKVTVEVYFIVKEFQNVTVFRMLPD